MQKICLIIPCFNESNRLDLDEFYDFILQNKEINVCFVNDGSKDNTPQILSKFSKSTPSNVLFLNLNKNVGKAEAIRSGIFYSISQKKYDFIAYTDADLSTPLHQVLYLLNYMESMNKKMVFGSRFKRFGVIIHRTVLRHFLGRVFASLASLILEMPIYDTQCGLKIFSIEIARDVFENKFITKWLFDVEIFARLKSMNLDLHNDILEIPLLEWYEKKGSKLSFIDFLQVPIDFFKIWYYYRSI